MYNYFHAGWNFFGNGFMLVMKTNLEESCEFSMDEGCFGVEFCVETLPRRSGSRGTSMYRGSALALFSCSRCCVFKISTSCVLISSLSALRFRSIDSTGSRCRLRLESSCEPYRWSVRRPLLELLIRSVCVGVRCVAQ